MAVPFELLLVAQRSEQLLVRRGACIQHGMFMELGKHARHVDGTFINHKRPLSMC